MILYKLNKMKVGLVCNRGRDFIILLDISVRLLSNSVFRLHANLLIGV